MTCHKRLYSDVAKESPTILVVIDLQSTNEADVQQAVNNLPQHVIPVSGVPLPQPDNVTAVPVAWSFEEENHALWFCGYLKGRIPEVRIMVYNTMGAVAHY